LLEVIVVATPVVLSAEALPAVVAVVALPPVVLELPLSAIPPLLASPEPVAGFDVSPHAGVERIAKVPSNVENLRMVMASKAWKKGMAGLAAPEEGRAPAAQSIIRVPSRPRA
jgi:hypothetical protein